MSDLTNGECGVSNAVMSDMTMQYVIATLCEMAKTHDSKSLVTIATDLCDALDVVNRRSCSNYSELQNSQTSEDTSPSRIDILKRHMNGEKGAGLQYDHAVMRSAYGTTQDAATIVRRDFMSILNATL